MNLNHNIKAYCIDIICYLYILLFIYAAISKVLDFETFRVQLGQSPLLSAYADWIVYIIPFLEIVISILLSIKRYKYLGLLFGFGLMLMFTTYIVIILNYSPFIPCSCGGILSDMNWNQHLIFNIFFTSLALIGIVILKYQNQHNYKNTVATKSLLNFKYSYIIHLLSITFLSISSVIVIFVSSEEEIHRNNAFIRRYPQHPVTALKGVPMEFNSYYIAGFSKGKIYLGNKTAPLHLLSFDTLLKNQKTIRIKILDSKEYKFESVQVIVKESKFYIYDGSIPIIYGGNTSDWNARTIIKGNDNFALLLPTTADSFVLRSNSKKNSENILATITSSLKPRAEYHPEILKKKIDGIFDTDGMLIYNEDLNKVIYSYYYRNTFIVSDPNLKSSYTGKTIDTMSFAPMDFTYLKSKKEKKFAKQPIMVQKFAASSGKYLFIKSDRLGKYESEKMLKDASIIDVYNLEKKTYEFSFYLYNYENEEIKSFSVYQNLFVGLTDKHLIVCKLKSKYFSINRK